MGKRTRWGLVIAALILGVAVASAAQAAPGPRLSLTVDRKTAFVGQAVVATARANTTCSWLFVWGTERQVRTGRSASVAFVAPVVTRRTEVPLTARCFARTAVPGSTIGSAGPVTPDGDAAGQRLVVRVPPSGEDTVTVTVLPAGNAVSPPGDSGVLPGSEALPDAGGPVRGLLVAGLVSFLAGVLAVRYARRSRRESTASSTAR